MSVEEGERVGDLFGAHVFLVSFSLWGPRTKETRDFVSCVSLFTAPGFSVIRGLKRIFVGKHSKVKIFCPLHSNSLPHSLSLHSAHSIQYNGEPQAYQEMHS